MARHLFIVIAAALGLWMGYGLALLMGPLLEAHTPVVIGQPTWQHPPTIATAALPAVGSGLCGITAYLLAKRISLGRQDRGQQ